MRLAALICVLYLLGTACKKKNAVPGGIIQQKQMQAIMWDMMRADQFVTDYIINRNPGANRAAESFRYYQQIFAMHKVSRDQFENSFTWYNDHPDMFKEIMDSVAVMPGIQSTPSILSPGANAGSLSKQRDTPQKILPDTAVVQPKSVTPVKRPQGLLRDSIRKQRSKFR